MFLFYSDERYHRDLSFCLGQLPLTPKSVINLHLHLNCFIHAVTQDAIFDNIKTIFSRFASTTLSVEDKKTCDALLKEMTEKMQAQRDLGIDKKKKAGAAVDGGGDEDGEDGGDDQKQPSSRTTRKAALVALISGRQQKKQPKAKTKKSLTTMIEKVEKRVTRQQGKRKLSKGEESSDGEDDWKSTDSCYSFTISCLQTLIHFCTLLSKNTCCILLISCVLVLARLLFC